MATNTWVQKTALGEDVFSYNTCIRTVLRDPQTGGRYTVGNVSRYSKTTSKHQNEWNVALCDITVTELPRGATADDLRIKAFAKMHGVI